MFTSICKRRKFLEGTSFEEEALLVRINYFEN